MQLSGTVTASTACSMTISPLALYPARRLTPSGIIRRAFIWKNTAPFSEVPFGAIYSSTASNVLSFMAPMVIIIGIPSLMRPTSVSSILPTKIMSRISATVAMVVPSLKVLELMTLFPTFTGTSKIIPSIVDFIDVLVYSEAFFEIPSFTMFSWSRALS